MNDRNSIISQIEDLLGNDGSRALATQVFDHLRATGDISYTDSDGLVLADDVDVTEIAAGLIEAQ